MWRWLLQMLTQAPGLGEGWVINHLFGRALPFSLSAGCREDILILFTFQPTIFELCKMQK